VTSKKYARAEISISVNTFDSQEGLFLGFQIRGSEIVAAEAKERVVFQPNI
jgi:hypothetical protein